MKILALDLSLTATGWARSVDDYGVYETGDLRGVERLDQLWVWIWENLVTDHGDLDLDQSDLVIVEGYAFSARGRAMYSIAEWGGIARLAIHRAAVPYVELPPAVLKKFATGRGNAPKPDLRMELYKRSGLDVADDNAVDALWLLAAARERYGEPLWPMPKANVEALGKVDWPEIG